MFFEGIERQLASGVAPKDVSYQMKYSKQELRKCIKEYPTKVVSTVRLDLFVIMRGMQVKASLEDMYRRVQRQLNAEEGLTVLVWRSIHEEFIHLCKRFADLIETCYPDTGIKLDFDIDDLQAFFDTLSKDN